MIFIIYWLINYCLVMFAMCTDNVFWISSSPEYNQFKKMSLKNKTIYVVRDRIYAVLKDWRDICPALITATIMTLIQLWM